MIGEMFHWMQGMWVMVVAMALKINFILAPLFGLVAGMMWGALVNKMDRASFLGLWLIPIEVLITFAIVGGLIFLFFLSDAHQVQLAISYDHLRETVGVAFLTLLLAIAGEIGAPKLMRGLGSKG